ncbi:MAG: anaerobic ribonucleoside-triphosphate reductase [Anaerolineae bacterium]|jgi:anaerobic ribonucleoside-triphosphate reductase
MTTRQKTEQREGVEVKVPCEVYSRIVGYLRPVQNWHDGKRQEFKERVTYRVSEESE